MSAPSVLLDDDWIQKGPPRLARWPSWTGLQRRDSLAEPDHIACRRALVAFDDLELNSLPLDQSPETLGIDGSVVHEAVILPIFGGDESETLGVVEPFHSSVDCHAATPPEKCRPAVLTV